MRPLLLLPLALLAAGCAPDGGTSGIAGLPILNEPRRACIRQAEAQGLEVVRVVPGRPVTGAGGRTVGSVMTMTVTRGGQTFDVRCTFENDTAAARIAPLVDADADDTSALEAEARRACLDQAAREAMGEPEILSSRPTGGSGGRIVGAALTLRALRAGEPVELRCDYTVATGEARIASL